jgi:hypothetical protein
MRPWRLVFLAPALAVAGLGLAVAAETEKVPVYTREDLDRMFGPAPASPSVPVDKSRPEDWRPIEQFLDREYARIEAQRQIDLNRREMEIATRQEESREYYGGSLLWGWGAGYPGYDVDWKLGGPGFGRGDHRGVGAAVCRGSGYRLGHASVATSIRRAGISRPSRRH